MLTNKQRAKYTEEFSKLDSVELLEVQKIYKHAFTKRETRIGQEFTVGQQVRYPLDGGVTGSGEIIKINQKTIRVLDKQGRRILCSPSLLTAV